MMRRMMLLLQGRPWLTSLIFSAVPLLTAIAILIEFWLQSALDPTTLEVQLSWFLHAPVLIVGLAFSGLTFVFFEAYQKNRFQSLNADAESSFSSFVQGVIDYAIFYLDTQGNVASWNDGAKRIKGYDAKEVIGRHFSIFYTPKDLLLLHPDEVLRIAKEEGRFEEEGLRVRKDGSLFWARVLITAIRDGKKICWGFPK